MQASQAAPDAMVLGIPIFDDSAPRLRVQGRKISNWWANLETLWSGIHDSLFGFRVYPILTLGKHNAPAAVDAALRLRRGGSGASALARRQAHQLTGRRCATSGPTRAAFHISVTGATTAC